MALMEAAEWSASERKAHCLRQVSTNARDEATQALLADCIRTYLPLGPDQEREVAFVPEATHVTPFEMTDLTWAGRAMLNGEIRALARILRRRFGEGVPSEADLRGRLTTFDEVEELLDKAATATSLGELGLTWP